jgi:hypothetical protein
MYVLFIYVERFIKYLYKEIIWWQLYAVSLKRGEQFPHVPSYNSHSVKTLS